MQAIKAREDVLERLRIAGGKLDSGFGGSAPVVLSPVDPMVRLFYRLVGSLRQRTLDVIEAISAWRRKVARQGRRAREHRVMLRLGWELISLDSKREEDGLDCMRKLDVACRCNNLLTSVD